MSETKYYCAWCNYGTNDRSNFYKHEKTESHQKNVIRGSTSKLKVIKKSDYTLTNFVPLKLDRKDCHYYEDVPHLLNLNMDSTSICKEFLTIFVTKHKLDQEGYLVPFIKEISLKTDNPYANLIKKTLYSIPQIVDGKIEWVSFEGDLIKVIQNSMDALWMSLVQRNVLNFHSKQHREDDPEKANSTDVDQRIIDRAFDMILKKKFVEKFEALMKKSFNI